MAKPKIDYIGDIIYKIPESILNPCYKRVNQQMRNTVFGEFEDLSPIFRSSGSQFNKYLQEIGDEATYWAIHDFLGSCYSGNFLSDFKVMSFDKTDQGLLVLTDSEPQVIKVSYNKSNSQALTAMGIIMAMCWDCSYCCDAITQATVSPGGLYMEIESGKTYHS